MAHRSMAGLGRENQQERWRDRVVEDKEEEEDGDEYGIYDLGSFFFFFFFFFFFPEKKLKFQHCPSLKIGKNPSCPCFKYRASHQWMYVKQLVNKFHCNLSPLIV